ncbi:hypothetical protein [Cohnella faecalis]|uniref:hypothetical protein n=1 Tax=Cohnella faecalis TaxID=2315694 RepID=UPI0013146685|nr:hypothetical protein [Cohnella faecalis]
MNYGAPFPEVVIEKVADAALFGYEGHAFQLHSLAERIWRRPTICSPTGSGLAM